MAHPALAAVCRCSSRPAEYFTLDSAKELADYSCQQNTELHLHSYGYDTHTQLAPDLASWEHVLFYWTVCRVRQAAA